MGRGAPRSLLGVPSHHYPLSPGKGPLSLKNINSALSFHYLGTEDHEAFFEGLSLALAVRERNELLNCVSIKCHYLC